MCSSSYDIQCQLVQKHIGHQLIFLHQLLRILSKNTSEPVIMSAFIKSDLRKTGEYGDCFNQYLFDLLSTLVDKSNEQVSKLNLIQYIY